MRLLSVLSTLFVTYALLVHPAFAAINTDSTDPPLSQIDPYRAKEDEDLLKLPRSILRGSQNYTPRQSKNSENFETNVETSEAPRLREKKNKVVFAPDVKDPPILPRRSFSKFHRRNSRSAGRYTGRATGPPKFPPHVQAKLDLWRKQRSQPIEQLIEQSEFVSVPRRHQPLDLGALSERY